MKFEWNVVEETWFTVACKAVAIAVFFCVLPVGFIFGAIWSGVYVGFIAGRDV